MPPVHCEVWAGFIFVNLAKDPVPLRTFLGEGLLGMETYPFHLMTQRYGFSTRIKGNWKLAVDSVCEWYHPPYVHGRFIDPDVVEGREDGAAGRLVPLRPVPAAHADVGARTAAAASRASRATRARRARISSGSTSCSAPGSSDRTTCPTSGRCRSS